VNTNKPNINRNCFLGIFKRNRNMLIIIILKKAYLYDMYVENYKWVNYVLYMVERDKNLNDTISSNVKQ